MRSIFRLTAQSVKSAIEPGLYSDGGGLYLRVAAGGSRSFVFIFQWHGRRREMGLGGLDSVTLARAREKAAAARAMVADDIDPIAVRRAARAVPTFGTVADEYIHLRSATARSDKSIARWKRSLGQGGYSEPIRDQRVDTIDTPDVLAILKPLWLDRRETARVLRSHIEGVLDLAKSNEQRKGENPARWVNHLENLLPAQTQKVKHHGAIPWQEMPEFWRTLAARNRTTSVQALRLTILAATRTGETIFAKVKELDLDAKIWTVPAERMKSGAEHQIPLSEAALAIAREAAEGKGPDDYLFPGQKFGAPLSNMAMLKLLKNDMSVDSTVHGTARSSFRDWCGDATDYPREIAEMALAHAVGDATELAYRRGRALSRRARLMEDWAAYLGAGAFEKAVEQPPAAPAEPPAAPAEPIAKRAGRRDCVGQTKLFAVA